MDVERTIKQYLQSKHIMQLATVRDGQPWCCSVHFWADEDANLYWISTEAWRHSEEIRDNNHVAAAIAAQTDEGKPGTPVIGIQVEGDSRAIHPRASARG